MAKLVGAMLALVAIGAGTLVGVEPMDVLMRGLIAFVVGFAVAQIWLVFFSFQPSRSPHTNRSMTNNQAVFAPKSVREPSGIREGGPPAANEDQHAA